MYRFHQYVDFGRGVVDVEAGAGGAREAELLHEGLVAVVTAAEGDAILVGEGDNVVGVGVAQGEADDAAADGAGAMDKMGDA